MKTRLEIKNKVANIHICTIIAINLSREISLLDQPMEMSFRKEEIDTISLTGINLTGKTTKEVLLLIRDWLNEI